MSFNVALFSIVESIKDVREYMGISYIKTYLCSKGIPCEAKTIIKAEIDEVLSGYVEFPQLIGISIYCNTIELMKEFVCRIKEYSPKCHVVVGGAHVMGFEEDILRRVECIDSVCTGEGEETIYELAIRLMKGESLLGCNGITYRNDKEIIKNEERKLMVRLDELPIPYREINPKNKKRYFYIVGSRGCLGVCTFCGEHKTGGCSVRTRSYNSIVNEMEYLWRKYKVNKFHFTDPTFEDPNESGIKRAREIYSELIRRNLHFRMIVYTRTNIVTKLNDEYYDLAYLAGVECFFVGIEAGNDEDMELYCKRASVSDNYNAIEKIQRHGIYVNYGFINFNPYSTFERIQENLRFLLNSGLVYNTHHIMSKLTIMPQAYIKNKMIKDGLIEDFHFDSDVTQYNFVVRGVGEFYDLISDGVDTDNLIDIDSQIGIDRVYYQKTNPDMFEVYLKDIFDAINKWWKARNEYLFSFYDTAIRIYMRHGNNRRFRNHLSLNITRYYNNKIKLLYLKYRTIIYKMEREG